MLKVLYNYNINIYAVQKSFIHQLTRCNNILVNNYTNIHKDHYKFYNYYSKLVAQCQIQLFNLIVGKFFHGASKWALRYPKSTGHFQSPIDIKTNQARYDAHLDQDNPLNVNYAKLEAFRMLNDGTTLKIFPLHQDDLFIKGGPLSNAYRFDHFHFHWGSENKKGSEHRINGKLYEGEVHFVHWNSEYFSNMNDASNYYNGLSVVGVFLKLGQSNPELDKIISQLSHIQNYQDSKIVTKELNLRHCLPENISEYWTYPGSLTTPPFSESVTWILLKNPMEISNNQLKHLFQLYSSELDETGKCKTMCNIFREPQPLNDRIVRKSFHH